MKKSMRTMAFLGALVIFTGVMLTSTEGAGQIVPQRWHYALGWGCADPSRGYADLTPHTNVLSDTGWEMVDIKPVGNIGTGTGCVIVIMRQLVAVAPK